jgi:MFS family permease
MTATASTLRSAPAPRLPWGLAWRLATGQIFAWGILYYAFTVVAAPMEATTGWGRPFINLGLSLGLLAWGICAYPAGQWIQRHGARGLMTLAAMAGGGALAVIGLTDARTLYLLAWLVLGAAMAGLLYEPAFAVVVEKFGPDYRRGITLVTLVGGLASTVFIPLSQLAVDQLGWRPALAALGILQALVVAPLHWWGVPAGSGRPRGPLAPAPDPRASGGRMFWRDARDPRFVGLAIWFAAHAAAFTGLIFQLVPLLHAWRVPSETILLAIAFMGPMQVAGRALLSTHGGGISALLIGQIATAILLGALLILQLLPPTPVWLVVFALLLGLGNGVLTIVRGVVVAELFGRDRYAELNGALAAPAVLAKAAAPLGLALVWSITGSSHAVPMAVTVLLLVGAWGLRSVASRPAPSAIDGPAE